MTVIMNKRMLFFIFLAFGWFLIIPPNVFGAALSIEPAAGSFVVGTTFNVSVFLNTEDESVNGVEAHLSFPPDKLQIVSPSTGFSIINSWIRQPSYNNKEGQIDFEGVIPGGVYANKGLISTLTFRAKSIGRAVVKFLDNSKVLLNDGKATDALDETSNGIYNFVLPPPAGPIVVSETHPDQSLWYNNSTVVLRWANENEVESYSYVFNESPVDLPDDISEGLKSSVAYRNIADGLYYFHVKALRNGVWGGTSHFAVRIDGTPPSEFPIEIIPFAKTVRRQPIIQFSASDALSGLDYYELKLVPLRPVEAETPLFIEVESPYVPNPLDLGPYDVIIRAYDEAGNYREVVKRLTITTAVFEFIGDEGLQIRSRVIVPWFWFWIIFGLILIILSYLSFLFWRRHHRVHFERSSGELPAHVKSQLEELKSYRKKYGKVLMIFIVLTSLFLSGNQVFAQEIDLSPPLITTISKNISNEEIFYIGGKTERAASKVIIYLQNLQTGETLSQNVESDRKGDWFYRHPNFLLSGNYLLWAQTKLGEELSPPSPQFQMTIRPTAIQFGASRLSYETIYLVIIILLAFVSLGLIAFTIYHGREAHRKRREFYKEVREAEESVRRGFAVLRRDIQAELAIVKKARLSSLLSAEEKLREEQLLKDLEEVEKYIGKEIWDIEHAEARG